MSTSPKAPPPSRQTKVEDVARFGTLGFEFTAGIAVFGLLGWWLDGLAGWRDTFPFLLVLGLFGGLALGIYRLQMRLRTPQAKNPDEQEAGAAATPPDDPLA